MKIKELINLLQQAEEKHGNLDVMVWSLYGEG